MKTLLLLRHAKSSWKKGNQLDHDRPLNHRGKRDAPQIGVLLDEQSILPDLIISSTAKRARKTAAKVAQASGYEGAIELTGELYLAPPAAYIHVLQSVDASVNRVLMIGHNPGIEQFVQQLTGEEHRMPTSALVQIQLPMATWNELRLPASGKLVRHWTPEMLEFDPGSDGK